MTFRFGGGSVRRYRLHADTETFEWRPQRGKDGPVFRDMSWDFQEPDRYPEDVTALMLAYRGRALTELGRHEEAITVLARVLEYPTRAASINAIALVGRGMIHQARGEDILAENDFTQALMEVPEDPEARQHIEELIHGRPPGA